MRNVIAVMLFFILLLENVGCTLTRYYTLPPLPPEDARRHLGTVAIVPAQSVPKSNFTTFAKGRLSGTGKGATEGISEGVLLGTFIAVDGGAVGVLLLPFFAAGGAIIGGVVGSLAGATKAVPAAKAREVESAISDALSGLNIQETMAENIIIHGTSLTDINYVLIADLLPSEKVELNYNVIKDEDVDSVLHVKVNSVELEGGSGIDPKVSLCMTASTKLINAQNGVEIYSGEFEYKGKSRKFTAWAADNAKLLREELENCFNDLSERIVDEAFLLLDFPLSYWSPYQYCMLAPVYPKTDFSVLKMQYVEVDSLRPTVRWGSFPRTRDMEADKNGVLKRVSKVVYDLKIWRVEDDFPVSLVYAVEGLPDPIHTLAYALSSSTKYFWTVRARFMLDGQQRATRWSYSRRPWIVQTVPVARGDFSFLFFPPVDPCSLNYIPNTNYFHFITPQR